jgi:hypothetical protein
MNKYKVYADTVKEIFLEDCKENNIEFSEEKFSEFMKYLEIDFYDWVQENINHFYEQEGE